MVKIKKLALRTNAKEEDYLILSIPSSFKKTLVKRLLPLTVDGKLNYDANTDAFHLKIYWKFVEKASKLLKVKLQVETQILGGIFHQTGKKPPISSFIVIDAVRQVVMLVTKNLKGKLDHTLINLDDLDLIWKELKRAGWNRVGPHYLFEQFGNKFGVSAEEFYGTRLSVTKHPNLRFSYDKNYYGPIKALKGLDLVSQRGTGPINLTNRGLSVHDWRDVL